MRAFLSATAALLLTSSVFASGWTDLNGVRHDPFSTAARTHVFIFLRTDCPLANRYAPELTRIAKQWKDQSVDFWLIYPDRSAQHSAIAKQIADFGLVGTPLLDPAQTLVQAAGATVSPEAAVFDGNRRLTYLGRIDDQVTGFGVSRPAPTTHDLESAIRQTLAGKPVAAPHTRAIGCYLADVK